jgi:DnaK suppressor protein
MDERTLDQIRGALVARWRKVGKVDVPAARAPLSDVDEAAPQAEIIDFAQHLEQLGRDTSLAEQERRELLAIERALSKLTSGSFGLCEDCGEEIPTRRLLVLPEARLCAGCQAYEERQTSRMRAAADR